MGTVQIGSQTRLDQRCQAGEGWGILGTWLFRQKPSQLGLVLKSEVEHYYARLDVRRDRSEGDFGTFPSSFTL